MDSYHAFRKRRSSQIAGGNIKNSQIKNGSTLIPFHWLVECPADSPINGADQKTGYYERHEYAEVGQHALNFNDRDGANYDHRDRLDAENNRQSVAEPAYCEREHG